MPRGMNRTACVLALAAFALAALSAKPYATAWNDGSRLASVEALVERGTFRIDGTTFLEGAPGAYEANNPLLAKGTLDKLLIDGHWYSDKPPLVSVPLAGAYRTLMACGAPAPSEAPGAFAWVVCVLLSGIGFAISVGCAWVLGARAGLEPKWRAIWLGAFALATVLPAYTRSANNHIAQLGAVAAVCVLLCRIADRTAAGRSAWGSLLAAGFVTGFAYNLDFGLGPPLVCAVLLAVALRTRSAAAVLVCGIGLLPCVLAGHAINFAIGGDWLKPLNMHREYLSWPGSPFDTTMTGVMRDRYFAQFLYTLDLLFGKKGFLTHNPPLLLAVTSGAWWLLRAKNEPRPQGSGNYRVELLALAGWCVAAWLMYGVLSKNHGGACVSVRWFVPFLAPGFWLLAHLLVARPNLRREFAVLALCGAPLAVSAWLVGPWWMKNVPGYWFVFGASLLGWGIARATAPRAKEEPPAALPEVPPMRRAA
jgi:hypothetical protein